MCLRIMIEFYEIAKKEYLIQSKKVKKGVIEDRYLNRD